MRARTWLVVLLIVVLAVYAGLMHIQVAEVERAAAKSSEAYAEERTKAATALTEASEKYRTTERQLEDQAAAARKKTNEATQSFAAQRDALLRRVRVAEERARYLAGVPEAAAIAGLGEVAPGDPGAELPGALGEADVHEAYRGELIRAHLIQCYQHYEAAQDRVKALQ